MTHSSGQTGPPKEERAGPQPRVYRDCKGISPLADGGVFPAHSPVFPYRTLFMTTQEGPTRRSMRLADQIMRELATLLAENIQDPRLELVTISGVRLNSDLTVATVLYTLSGDKDRIKAADAAFNKAKGFLRTHLSHALKSKFIPELRFKVDDFLETMVYGQHHA